MRLFRCCGPSGTTSASLAFTLGAVNFGVAEVALDDSGETESPVQSDPAMATLSIELDALS